MAMNESKNSMQYCAISISHGGGIMKVYYFDQMQCNSQIIKEWVQAVIYLDAKYEIVMHFVIQ